MHVWVEHSKKVQVDVAKDALSQAESKLASLDKDAKAKAWEHDTLQLARDVALIAELFTAVEKSDKAERLKRITHIRSENVIGASVVNAFMEAHASHKTGSEADLLASVDEAVASK